MKSKRNEIEIQNEEVMNLLAYVVKHQLLMYGMFGLIGAWMIRVGEALETNEPIERKTIINRIEERFRKNSTQNVIGFRTDIK